MEHKESLRLVKELNKVMEKVKQNKLKREAAASSK